MPHRPLSDLCVPRQSVFDTQRRDTVLDLNDLAQGRIDPKVFFEENYATEGMQTLVSQVLSRLSGQSDQGVYLLKQAMGGGKTHNLLTLGLIARHPEYKDHVLKRASTAAPSDVRVVAFSGRESDAPLGLWGRIAEQLDKRDAFSAYYSPLSAPGQTAWEELLRDETVLILLDELPPYFDNAESRQIGDSNLARVTATALANLLVAVERPGCERVCVVLTDLTATYGTGGQFIREALNNFKNETDRLAKPIEPVRMNSDELYHILRTRLFETLPSDEQITQVAQAYGQAMREARQMDITSESPEDFASRVATSYPFHPALRDLYGRFRENDGFQQTRGLIRLLRAAVAALWRSDGADTRYLFGPHDLDLNDEATRSEVNAIRASLQNAISHDIADQGRAKAERMDQNTDTHDTTDAARLLLVSSLATVPGAIQGLTLPEVVATLAAPGRDVTRLKERLEAFSTAAWYLHADRNGRLFFRDVQNLNAKLEDRVRTYVPEQAIRALRERLEKVFEPLKGDIYRKVLVLPVPSEIELSEDHVTLVVTQPVQGAALNPDLKAFYDNAQWKNRVMFLTGARDTYDTLLNAGRRLRAIDDIIREDQASFEEQQRVQAEDLRDKALQHFHSAVRETFTTLHYPTRDGLAQAPFLMTFEGNRYVGEDQILALLLDKQKFTREVDPASDAFRLKCEQRLFTQQAMPWRLVRQRAASSPAWQWHHPRALDDLRDEMVRRDRWREEGEHVNKGPFPQPSTSVTLRVASRHDDTGEATLHVVPVHGDTLHYDVGATATPSSAVLQGTQLSTKELVVSFLCVDSKGQHETGDAVTWQNTITTKHAVRDEGASKRIELRAAPLAPIRYTTDGSNPRDAGATYTDPFLVPAGTAVVLYLAERGGVSSDVVRIPLHWEERQRTVEIDPARPASYRQTITKGSTREVYDFLDRAAKHGGQFTAPRLGVVDGEAWVDFSSASLVVLAPEQALAVLNVLREVQGSGDVTLEVEGLDFESGAALEAFARDEGVELTPQNVRQSR